MPVDSDCHERESPPPDSNFAFSDDDDDIPQLSPCEDELAEQVAFDEHEEYMGDLRMRHVMKLSLKDFKSHQHIGANDDLDVSKRLI